MLKPKNIVKNKKCLLCENAVEGTGITIMGNFICESCITEINKVDVNDERYDEIKNKLKGILIDFY